MKELAGTEEWTESPMLRKNNVQMSYLQHSSNLFCVIVNRFYSFMESKDPEYSGQDWRRTTKLEDWVHLKSPLTLELQCGVSKRKEKRTMEQNREPGNQPVEIVQSADLCLTRDEDNTVKKTWPFSKQLEVSLKHGRKRNEPAHKPCSHVTN